MKPKRRLMRVVGLGALLVSSALATSGGVVSCGGGKGKGGGKTPAEEREQRFSKHSVTIFSGVNRDKVELPPLPPIVKDSRPVPSRREMREQAKKAGMLPEPSEAFLEWVERYDAKQAKKKTDLPGRTERTNKAKKTNGDKSGPALREQAIIDGVDQGGGGARPVSVDVDLAQFGSDDMAFALMWGAAQECGMNQDISEQATLGMDAIGTYGTYLTYPQLQEVPAVGSADIFYMTHPEYPDSVVIPRPNNCETLLLQQEILACMAGKLTELADSVSPVLWQRVHPQPDLDNLHASYAGNEERIRGYPKGPWMIPPLHAEDRFIVREHALHVLSQLAWLDHYQDFLSLYSLPADVVTCEAVYALALTQAPEATWDSWRQVLFGLPESESQVNVPLDNLNLIPSFENREALLRNRLDRRRVLLKFAGELVGELVTDSVYADMAGAFQQRAMITDPTDGLQLMWGVSELPEQRPYNTLAHAARVLFADWAVSAPQSDSDFILSHYGSHLASEDDLFGAELLSRAHDIPVSSNGQEVAIQLIEAEGIVMPSGYDQVPREALEEHLVLSRAQELGFTPGTDEFDEFAANASVKSVLARIPDQDLRFALDRNLRTYQQLSGRDGSTLDGADLGGGLVSSPVLGEELGGLGAVAILDLAKTDLAVDIMGRLGGLQTARQQPVSCTWPDRRCPASELRNEDVYSSAAAFLRGLTSTRGELTAAGIPTDDELVQELLRDEAEIETIAGPGVIGVEADVASGLIRIGLFGFTESDWGDSSVWDGIALVYGPPWVADCAAGLRQSCPSGFAENYVQSIDSMRYYGGLAQVGYESATTVTCDWRDPEVPQFLPELEGDGEPGSRLYVVAPRVNRVLAALRLEEGVTSFETVSNHQRQLVNAALGIGADYPSRGNYLGAATSGDPPSYCIEGVTRDAFIPLENELTENSDAYENSWRHYLGLAKDSADRAERIADQIFQLEMQKDLRFEASQEELGAICGQFSPLDDIYWDGNGQPVLDETPDAALAQCLDEPKYDVVLLTKDPRSHSDCEAYATGGSCDADCGNQCVRERVLGCTADDDREVCTKPDFSYSALGLIEFPENQGSNEVNEACHELGEMVQSQGGALDLHSLSLVGVGKWRSTDALLDVLQSLQLKLHRDGHWTLESRGVPMMDSSSATLWPGCRWGTAGCSEDYEPAQVFENLFVLPVPPGPDLSTLPQAAASMYLYWQVQGSLWTLAQFAGKAPKGLFVVQYPAAQLYDGVPNIPVPPGAIFGSGEWAIVPGEESLVLASQNEAEGIVSAADQSIIQDAGGARRKNTDFDWSVIGSNPWVFGNAWFAESAYTAGERYLHIQTPNREWTTTPPDDLSLWLSSVTAGATGRACSQVPSDLARDLWAPKLQVCAKTGVAVFEVDNATGSMEFRHRVVARMPWEEPDLHPTLGPWKINDVLLTPDESIDESAHAFVYYRPEGGDSAFSFELPPTNYFGAPFGTMEYVLDRHVLRPSACSPRERALMVVNTAVPASGCEQISKVAQALGLACVEQTGNFISVDLSDPPKGLKDVEDLPVLEAWARALGKEVNAFAAGLYALDVPERAIGEVTDLVNEQSYKGQKGDGVMMVREHLENVALGLGDASKALTQLGNHIDGLGIDLVGVDLSLDAHRLQLARERIAMTGRLLLNFNQEMAGIASRGLSFQTTPIAVAGALANFELAEDYHKKELAIIQEIEGVAIDQAENQFREAFNAFSELATERFSELEKSLALAGESVLKASAASDQVEFMEETALYYAALGAGEPYVTVNGERVRFPVNERIQNQLDVLNRRYEIMENEARYLAYLARLAIEQRIGMRLNDIDQKIGNWEPPSIWADDICTMTGANYDDADFDLEFDDEELLMSFEPTQEILREFQEDALETIEDGRDLLSIADYVVRLENFIAFYNLKFPAKDAEDLVVTSLVEDLLPTSNSWCTIPSRNLLRESGAAHQAQATSSEGESAWASTICDGYACLSVQDGASQGFALPAAAPKGGSVWLWDTPVEAGGDGEYPSASSVPPRSVFQTVSLAAGAYLLSWWDRAVEYSAVPEVDPTTPYVVSVISSEGEFLATYGDHANSDDWSPRRVLGFRIEQPREVSIVLQASGGGDQYGSVAIANIQLEAVASVEAASTAYEDTDTGGRKLTRDCQGPGVLQSLFEYKCDSRCFYELAAPFVIDTKAIVEHGTPLSEKFASGNYNFRHVDLAVNLVGTGVIDCGVVGTVDCYGTGTVEYSLEHRAFDARIVDHNGESRWFNFGKAGIHNADALATERYITTPMGSADLSLLSQPQIRKPELSGRPLDGVYQFRVYESPALVWDKLEDIQFVLWHRYWSRVSSKPEE